ncbi:hypothetical protein [Niabella aurantiaca]|uniref:hypothetical protein n=1 Tax=Niabella aurantiaca TaxID=379900 RepID=UPI00037F658D|nr:hypothetical protein [Niabella aurantiaca]
MYYDSTAMKENEDMVAFDIKKSKITHVRCYLKNNRLIHVSNSDATSFPPDDLPRERGGIKDQF